MTEEKFEEIRKGWQLINEHNRITEENIIMKTALESIASWNKNKDDIAIENEMGITFWRGCVSEAIAALQKVSRNV